MRVTSLMTACLPREQQRGFRGNGRRLARVGHLDLWTQVGLVNLLRADTPLYRSPGASRARCGAPRQAKTGPSWAGQRQRFVRGSRADEPLEPLAPGGADDPGVAPRGRSVRPGVAPGCRERLEPLAATGNGRHPAHTRSTRSRPAMSHVPTRRPPSMT
jgi:hypothetical protein